MSRPPSREVSVSEIYDNGRYTVVGYVVDFDPRTGEGRIDDGTAVLRVILDDMTFAEEMEVGRYVRAMGRVYISQEGKIMRAEIVQRMGIEPEIYRKLRELERRVVTC